MTAGAATTWEDALAGCEARLDAAEAALEAGNPTEVAPFEPLIPAALVDRARQCATRSDELQTRLAAELERIRLELRRLPRMPPAPQEHRFDAQA
jgi:hypothetical protein